MAEEICVLVKAPGRDAEDRVIPDTLRALQEIVGGRIEMVSICRDLVVICSAEMISSNARYNCTIRGIQFFGPIVLSGARDDVLTSLPCMPPSLRPYLPELWPEAAAAARARPKLPCRIGDTVWGIRRYKHRMMVRQGRVREMYYTDDMDLVIVVEQVCRGRWGQRVFPTREAAEQALGGDGDAVP